MSTNSHNDMSHEFAARLMQALASTETEVSTPNAHDLALAWGEGFERNERTVHVF